MNNVLLSIKTKYANQIFSGEKTFEYRKKSLGEGNCNKKIYIYSSGIDKAIIGYIVISEILSGDIEFILKVTNNENNKEIIKYFNGSNACYALKISETKRFDKKILLEDIKEVDKEFSVPQYFRYIKENEYLNKLLKDNT